MVDWQSAPTDVEVMRWVREGDGPAFRLLYDRYAHLLFPLALRILKDHQEAEDALQEVFVQVRFPKREMCSTDRKQES
jgi:RNA polymerase sigma-70 factor (ECF subfamily)